MSVRRIFFYFSVFASIICPLGLGATQSEVEIRTETPPQELVLTLDDCVRLALENNEKLKGLGYGVEASKHQLEEAKAALWPVFEYEYRIAPVPTDAVRAFDAFFEGQVTLFNSFRFAMGIPIMASGQLSTARNLGESGLAASKENQAKERDAVVLQVKQLYYGVLLAAELERLLSDAAGKIENELKEQQEMEIPTHSPYDILKLKGFKLDMEKRLAETKQNKAVALEGLRIQTGLDPQTKLYLATKNLSPLPLELSSLESYFDASMKNRPEAHLLDIGVEVKRLQYQLEKRKLGPKLGFGFFAEIGRTVSGIKNLAMQDDFNDPFDYSRAGAGLQLSSQLDLHGGLARIKKAKAEYLKATYEKTIANKGLKLELERSFLTAKRCQENIGRAKKAESLAHQMMFLTKTNIETGVGDDDEYAEALQYTLLSRGQYFQSVFEYNVALADLEQKVGRIDFEGLTKASSPDMFEPQVEEPIN